MRIVLMVIIYNFNEKPNFICLSLYDFDLQSFWCRLAGLRQYELFQHHSNLVLRPKKFMKKLYFFQKMEIFILHYLFQCLIAVPWWNASLIIMNSGYLPFNNERDGLNFIDSNVKAAVDGGTLTTFSSDLSTHLNSLWDTAWNVVTVQTIAQKDTVLYGYAFRDHWMWYNGYRISGKIFGFVIWKDYNCKNWGNVGKDAPQGIPITKQIYDCMDQTIDISDIWKVGKAFINNLKGQADFQGDKAYSIVLSQDYDNTEMYGRVCMVDNKHFYSSIVTKTKPGRMMFFQTR